MVGKNRPDSRLPLAQASGWLLHGPLGSVLMSRAYVPVCLCLGLIFLAGSGVQLALRLGWAPPRLLPAPQHTIVITGPGVDGSTTIEAYVLGAVTRPGVYTLPAGARVRDLVQSAGGLTPDADLVRVDLAAHVLDGQEVYVPHVGEVVPAAIGALVDLNSASATDLHAALGISLTIAHRIVAYRETHGPFTAVSQLLLVPISRSTYDRIKYLVTV
jgi:competence protein ComEA